MFQTTKQIIGKVMFFKVLEWMEWSSKLDHGLYPQPLRFLNSLAFNPLVGKQTSKTNKMAN